MIKYRNVNIPLFSIPPNWASTFRFGEAFGEYISEAISTKEDRLMTSPRPVHSIGFKTLTLSEQETGYIRKAIEAAGDMPIAIPLWNLRCKLTADAVIGNSFVYCDDTAGSAFDIAPYCVMWRDFDFYETFRTFAIGANAIQTDAMITKQFRAGDTIAPLIVGIFKRQENPAVTDTLGEFPADFQERFITPGPATSYTFNPVSVGFLHAFQFELIGGELFDQFSKDLPPEPGT